MGPEVFMGNAGWGVERVRVIRRLALRIFVAQVLDFCQEAVQFLGLADPFDVGGEDGLGGAGGGRVGECAGRAVGGVAVGRRRFGADRGCEGEGGKEPSSLVHPPALSLSSITPLLSSHVAPLRSGRRLEAIDIKQNRDCFRWSALSLQMSPRAMRRAAHCFTCTFQKEIRVLHSDAILNSDRRWSAAYLSWIVVAVRT